MDNLTQKLIYRPDFVLSHFVHYSTVTKDLIIAEPFKTMQDEEKIVNERFID